jgi:hypothetical protein
MIDCYWAELLELRWRIRNDSIANAKHPTSAIWRKEQSDLACIRKLENNTRISVREVGMNIFERKRKVTRFDEIPQLYTVGAVDLLWLARPCKGDTRRKYAKGAQDCGFSTIVRTDHDVNMPDLHGKIGKRLVVRKSHAFDCDVINHVSIDQHGSNVWWNAFHIPNTALELSISEPHSKRLLRHVERSGFWDKALDAYSPCEVHSHARRIGTTICQNWDERCRCNGAEIPRVEPHNFTARAGILAKIRH